MLSMSVCFAGCGTSYVANRYVSYESVQDVLTEYEGMKIGVAEFTSDQSGSSGDFGEATEYVAELPCRQAGLVRAPGEMTYPEYIRESLITELQMAGLYDPESIIQLSGYLERIRFSSTSGRWEITLRLSCGGRSTLGVVSSFEYVAGRSAQTACVNTANALMPAVQEMWLELVLNERFGGLIRQE